MTAVQELIRSRDGHNFPDLPDARCGAVRVCCLPSERGPKLIDDDLPKVNPADDKV